MHYGHGNNSYRYQQKIVADFSTNVWYGGEPAELKEHLFSRWPLINHYPEVLAESLTRRLALHNSVAPENILVTNGATEGIFLLAQLFRKKRSGIVIPSFSEYEDACRIHDHELCFLPDPPHSFAAGTSSYTPEYTASVDLPPPTPDLFWIGNPNNPTGTVFPGLETLIARNPQTTFAVDEAFIEFTDAIPSLTGTVTRYPNLVVFRSLTKTFAIPGLRLGYMVSSKERIGDLQKLKMPWSVNTLALEAGIFILDHYPAPHWSLADLLKDKDLFVRQLQQTGIEIVRGHTHFILCRTARDSAKDLQHWLLENYGLLIRDAGNFRGLDAGHFRLATLAPEKNQLMIKALQQWQQRSY
jgi:threonine-phosphate decarboxylase